MPVKKRTQATLQAKPQQKEIVAEKELPLVSEGLVRELIPSFPVFQDTGEATTQDEFCGISISQLPINMTVEQFLELLLNRQLQQVDQKFDEMIELFEKKASFIRKQHLIS